MASGTIKTPGWKLLWTNPNPTSAFAAQTVSLNLTNYSELFIVVANGTTSQTTGSTVNILKNMPTAPAARFSAYSGSTMTALYVRYFSANDSGVVIENGYEKQLVSPWTSTVSNTTQIPLYIYAR